MGNISSGKMAEVNKEINLLLNVSTNEMYRFNHSNHSYSIMDSRNHQMFERLFEVYPHIHHSLHIFGILSNLLVMVTMTKTPKLREKSSGILITVLALVDMLYLLYPYILMMISQPNLKYACYVSMHILFALWLLSYAVVLLISINRYMLVCHPFNHHKVTSKKATYVQLGLAFAICFGCTAFIWGYLDKNQDNCSLDIFEDTYIPTFIHIIPFSASLTLLVMLGVVTPYTAIVVLTVLVIKEINQSHTTLNKPASTEGEKQITKSFLAIIIIFLIMVFPYIIAYYVFLGYLLSQGNVSSLQYEEIYQFFSEAYGILFATFILQLWHSVQFSLTLYVHLWCNVTFRQAFVCMVTCRKPVMQGSPSVQKSSMSRPPPSAV